MKSRAGIFSRIAIASFAIFATACVDGVYNAGDPASREWAETRIVECLLNPNCPAPEVAAPVPTLALGENAPFGGLLLIDGRVRTWGFNSSGQLGHDNTTNVGDGVGPSIISAGDVAVGGTPSELSLGLQHMCALFPGGTVRCWGGGGNGRLGYSNSDDVADGVGISIIAAGDVPVGGTVTKIDLGTTQTCALLTSGNVRCWGNGSNGRLGHNATSPVGSSPGNSIINTGDVPIGGTVTDIGIGGGSGCAILSAGNLRCWGENTDGQLGYGNTTDVADGTGPAIIAAGDVPVGEPVLRVSAGPNHTCALLSGGRVRCWGSGANGRLGYNSTANVGDGVGASIIASGDVPVGGTVTQIAVGTQHTCALLDTGAVRCWGQGNHGRLGHNSTTNIGDGTGPSIIAAGDVPLGGTAARVSAYNGTTCAILTTGALRCWGNGGAGRLGNNSTDDVGDGVGLSIIDAGDIPYE